MSKVIIRLSFIFLTTLFSCSFWVQTSHAENITWDNYASALKFAQKVDIPAAPHGDKKPLKGLYFKPDGTGPFPGIVALHGAGGIFPYQAWWAKKLSEYGIAVIFVDNYCTRDLLCEYSSGDNDRKRGKVMRQWDVVSIRQRMYDAIAGYLFLSDQAEINNDSIGLVGWSWGGTTALFAQKFASRLKLPEGGFKSTIAFYPNLVHVQENRQWKQGGKISQPTLILYGKSDRIEDETSYMKLLNDGHPGPIKVLAFDKAVRKFDELGPHRIKKHPRFGSFPKAFHQESFTQSILEVDKFVKRYVLKIQ